MLVESVARLRNVLVLLQGNADTDPESLVEAVQEIEEAICNLLDFERKAGKEWLSQRLAMFMLQVDDEPAKKKKRTIPASCRRRSRKA